MTVEELRWLFAYNRWANIRLLQAGESLSIEDLNRDVRASFGSLRGTLIHILWGERGWLHFWQEASFVPRPGPSDYPDFASLQRAWAHHEELYEGYLRGLTQAELDAPRTLDAVVYTLGELVQQALNHSTYHRGQVALLIRQLGHEPPSTDFHDFLAEARARPA